MKPSSFAPNGLLELKSGSPAAELLHATAVELFSDGSEFALSTEVGSFVDCFAFAFARVLAKAQLRQGKLDRERLAAGAYELLPQLEEEFGLRPGPEDTLRTRRRALLAAMKAALGSRRPALEQALIDLLGDDYVGLHVPDPATEVSIWPADLGDDPQLLALPDAPRKLVRLPNAISTGLGAAQFVVYEPIDPAPEDETEHTLLVGDEVVVGVENLGLAETVTVTDLDFTSSLRFEATFSNVHDPDALGAAMPFPAWGSNQRHIHLVLSQTAALDPETRRKVHDLMARTVTGVTTWAICPASGPAQAGPWTLGSGPLARLGMNPMRTISVP